MRKIFHKTNVVTALKILLPTAYLLLLVFIFGNSLQPGEQSAQTSSRVVDTVQAVVAWIAPESPIATATGEAYERLHADIRILAHFSEFVLLGALTCGCALAYGIKWKYFWLGLGSLLIVPILDETLQSFTANRAAELLDVMVDFSGGIVGFSLVLLFGYVYVRGSRLRSLWRKEGQERKE